MPASPLLRGRSKSFSWKSPAEEVRDRWTKGWQGHPAWCSGTRYSVTVPRKEGFQTSIDRMYNTHTGSFKERAPYAENKTPTRTRDTWIMKHMRNTHWTPGPGTYKSEREFMCDSKDEVDTNLTVQERAPDFSIGRESKETGLPGVFSKQKPIRNHGRYPFETNWYTPGPGTYTQYTQFAASSGGDRKTWLNRKHEFPWPDRT